MKNAEKWLEEFERLNSENAFSRSNVFVLDFIKRIQADSLRRGAEAVSFGWNVGDLAGANAGLDWVMKLANSLEEK